MRNIRVKFVETRIWEEDEEVPEDWTDDQIEAHVNEMADAQGFREWDSQLQFQTSWHK